MSNSESIATIAKHWGWYLFCGIVLIILGAIGAVYSYQVSIIVMFWIGLLLMAAGVFKIIYAFFMKHVHLLVVSLLFGVVSLLLGGFILAYPVTATLTFALIISGFLFVNGILQAGLAFSLRQEPAWWAFLITGAISVLLAVLIWMNWPASGLWIIGFFISLEVFFTGWSLLIMSVVAKSRMLQSA